MTGDMYSFFGLLQPAFGPILEPAQIFRSGLVEPVVKELQAGAHVLAIRGGPGTGKTAFMHVLAMELQARKLAVVMIDADAPTPADVKALIGQAGGLSTAAVAPETLLRALWEDAGVRRLIVLCDNAERLSADAFRTLSSLLQLRFTQPLRLQLLLLGELGPWPGLADLDLTELRQASTSRYITFSLRKDEAAPYLDHRLRYAGQPLLRVMTPSAVAELREQAHCNPRRLDELAERALSYGYRTRRRRLTAGSVRRALLAQPVTGRSGSPRTPIAVAALSILAVSGLAAWFSLSGAPTGEPVRPPTVLPTKQAALDTPAQTAPPPSPPHPAHIRVARSSAAVLAKAAIPPSAVPISAKPVASHDHAALAAAPPPQPSVRHNTGLVLIAGPRDTMPTLYRQVYRGLTPPPYDAVLAANPVPVKPGALLIFPEPPHGWTKR